MSNLDKHFLAPIAKIAGYDLYPLSAGTLTACRTRDLKVITGTAEEKAQIPPVRLQFEYMALLYFLTRTPGEGKQAVALPDEEFAALISDFEFTVPIDAIPKIQKYLAGGTLEVSEASFEVLPKPKEDGTSDAPPNSSSPGGSPQPLG